SSDVFPLPAGAEMIVTFFAAAISNVSRRSPRSISRRVAFATSQACLDVYCCNGSVDEAVPTVPARCAAGNHRIPAMRAHLPALDHGRMDPAPVLYMIRINGHLGPMILSAFPAMTPRRVAACTVLTGLLDRSA